MTDRTTYSIGSLQDPRPDDPRFDTEREVWNEARKLSYPARIVGVWRDVDGELIAIAYDGLVYWP